MHSNKKVIDLLSYIIRDLSSDGSLLKIKNKIKKQKKNHWQWNFMKVGWVNLGLTRI